MILEKVEVPLTKEKRAILKEIRLAAYQDWADNLDLQVEQEKITKKERNAKIVRALYARDLWAERFKNIAYQDETTGLPNRKAFKAKSTALIRSREPFGVLLVDIDFFKKINDTYGHLSGDRALVLTGLSMISSLRVDREGNNDDLVTRWGGEEFAILLPKVENEEDLQTVAERIRLGIGENPMSIKTQFEEQKAAITVSIGGGIFRGGNFHEFVELVDKQALYAAKDQGRDRSVILEKE